MRETSFVTRIPVSTPTLYPAITTNVYIIESEKEALIIDAGYENPESARLILDTLVQLGNPQVKGILLTHHHKDHAPGAKELSQLTGSPILCHSLESSSIEEQIHPLKVTQLVEDGEILQVGAATLQILHAPGHTKGHINIYLQEESLLFSGDNIVAQGTTWIGPPDGDMSVYLQTLHRLLQLKTTQIAPGHGELIRNPQEKIQFFIKRRLEREQQILALLAEKPRTVEELVQLIYEEQVHPSVLWVAERTIQGHLEKLVNEKRVIAADGYYSS